MLSLTRKASYGLVAMAHLACNEGRRISAREIAESNALPVTLVMNVLKQLCAAGYVESTRGVRGGYRLARRPDEIVLGPLLDEIEGVVEDACCKRADRGEPPRPAGEACPEADTCPHGNPVHRLHRQIRDLLQKLTLADIMGERTDVPLLAGLPGAASGKK